MIASPSSATMLDSVPCAVCGARDAAALFDAVDHLQRETFHVVRCRRCGLAYVDPRPSADALPRYYASGYYGSRHAVLTHWMMRLRVRKLPPRPGRLLDIGCGSGDFVLAARRRGWDVAGIEQADAPIMQRRSALQLDVRPPEALPELPAATFDVVTLWHVLEHLPDPAAVLHQAHRVLRPGGGVLIEVPNFGGWQARLGGARWFHLDVPRHLLHFERGPLTRLLHACGFTPNRWETLSLEYDAFGLAQTLLNRLCGEPNHLFQMIIRRPRPGVAWRDTLLSLVLFPSLLTFAAPASLVAAARGDGGVLRVWARKPT